MAVPGARPDPLHSPPAQLERTVKVTQPANTVQRRHNRIPASQPLHCHLLLYSLGGLVI